MEPIEILRDRILDFVAATTDATGPGRGDRDVPPPMPDAEAQRAVDAIKDVDCNRLPDGQFVWLLRVVREFRECLRCMDYELRGEVLECRPDAGGEFVRRTRDFGPHLEALRDLTADETSSIAPMSNPPTRGD